MSPLAAVLAIPLGLQATAMAVDEGYFHRRRGLGLWERVGHPIDTLSVAACIGWTLLAAPTAHNAVVYVVLAAVSCLLVTKDEAVHARRCSAAEHWLHAVLFVLHPLCLATFAAVWLAGRGDLPWLAELGAAAVLLPIQLALTVSFALYQALYWNVPWPSRSRIP